MVRLTDRKAVEIALSTAILWEESLIEAAQGDPDIIARAERNMSAYRRVLERMTGTRKSLAEIMDERSFANAKLVRAEDI